MADYYSILSRAVAGLSPNTPQARAALFDRAARMLDDDMRDHPERWDDETVRIERDNLDAAIERIESEQRPSARPAPRPSAPRSRPARAPAARSPMPPPPREVDVPAPARRMPMWLIAVPAAVLLVAVVGYLALSGSRSGDPDEAARKKIATAQSGKSTPQPAANGELEPGVDGGSNDAGLPYFLRRQLVYYRTVYSPGMIVIDRSPRHLYLVEPQVRAVRYGIGIGGECAANPGLRRISRIAEWPEWRPSAELLKRKSYPKSVAGGPGSPLGARAVYFEGDELGIHGTNAPKSIGQAVTLGCFRMVNDDITDLAKRIAAGAGVIVMN